MNEDEIFDKTGGEMIDNIIEPPKKPKRKLTEKQLENLKRGREKMAIKRAEEKKLRVEKKNNKVGVVDDEKESKEHKKITKKNLKEKRETLKKLNKMKEEELLAKLQKKDKDREDRGMLFEKLKVKCLESAKNVKQFNEIKSALEGIDEETLCDDSKLKSYAKDVMKPYFKNKD